MLIFDDGNTRIHRLRLGPIKTNSYIVECKQRCFLIDPVGESEKIISYLKLNHLHPEFLFATHAHFDHVSAAKDLLEAGLGKALYLHPNDVAELKRAKTMSLLIAKQPFDVPDFTPLNEETEQSLWDFDLKIMLLPGHTKGSVILYRKDQRLVFSGDLIINNLVVHSKSNPGENVAEFKKSVDRVEKMFPPTTLIFPGHGAVTRLDIELQFNKFIRLLRTSHA